MNPTRRHVFKAITLAIAWSSIMASSAASAHGGDDADLVDQVYTSTNAASNELLVYARTTQGDLTLRTRVATLGQGTAAGLGSQGAVTLSEDGRHLFVVNAASNTVSTFSLRGSEPRLVSVVDSGGLAPISVAEHDGLVYVLNAQGSGNVAGFRNVQGTLTPLYRQPTAPLSAAGGTNPAQVGFSHDGNTLVVTEKGTNQILTYRVRGDGSVAAPVVHASSGTTPFGFAFDPRDHLIVSEAFGGAANASAASSYSLGATPLGGFRLVSASVPTGQSAACWVVLTPNGRHAFTTNAGSSSLSRFDVSPATGKLSLSAGVAGSIGTGGTPIDAAMSSGGRYLYVLGAGSHGISSFQVRADGELVSGGFVGGLPAGSVGLAAN